MSSVPGALHFTLLPSTSEHSGLILLSTMELLIIIFALALSIASVSIGACLSLPEEVREKRSVPLSDHWSVPVDLAQRATLASVLAEENEAARFAERRAGAGATHLLVEDESKAGHFVVKREAPLHANPHQADD